MTDLRKLAKIKNIDWENSGDDTRLDTPYIHDFSGSQKKKGKTYMSTPIQPTSKGTRTPEPEAKDGDRTFKKRQKYLNSLA